MKQYLSILLFFLSITLNAQNISVTDFKLAEQDLTANQQGTIVLDQNGEKCALLKVRTTQTGFNFDAGSLGVSKVLQKTAEIWVYVPYGVRKLTISHQKYGTLEYSIPVAVQKAKTYIMDLKAETPLPVDHQRLTIKCQPKNAVVMIDGEMIETPNGAGEATLKLGSHKYVAMAQGYYQTEGAIELKAERPGRLSIDLEAKEEMEKEANNNLSIDSNSSVNMASKEDGPMAYEFTLYDASGTPMTLSRFRGKYLLLYFWGSWSKWCTDMFPDLKKCYEQHKEKLEVLGINCNDSEKKWKSTIEKYQLPWKNVYSPKGDNLTKLYSITGFPTEVIVNPDGRIIKTVVGADPTFFKIIDDILK